MNKVNKVVVDWDSPGSYWRQTYTLTSEMDYPFLAGSLQQLILADPGHKAKEELNEELELFNEKGLARLVIQIGSKGLYYLKLRPGYKLEKLFVEPDEIILDIFYGGRTIKGKTKPDKTLIYSFYNPTRRSSITISCRLVKDAENIWQKIYSNPDDLYWRQYFINSAKAGNVISAAETPPMRELMNQDQLAEYIQVTKKTIQNWTASRTIPFEKIPGTREVRYRKSKIDAALKSKDSPRRKKKK